MARFPVVFALATPEPEIGYEAARASRQDVIVATSLDRHPNAVLDLLSFPYIFRGALDVQATRITTGMLMAAARALAELAREEVVEEVERAYGTRALQLRARSTCCPSRSTRGSWCASRPRWPRQAIAEGVARRPLESEGVRGEPDRPPRHRPRDAARHDPERAAAEAARRLLRGDERDDPARLQPSSIDEGIASPILLGRESEVREAIERLGLDLGGVQIDRPGAQPALRRLRRRSTSACAAGAA